jgi:hypothetical protein
MVLLFYKWMLFLLTALFTLPPQAVAETTKHPFYVSVVEVAHNKTTATLEISCKLFAEDVEVVLEKIYKTPVDFNQPQQAKQIDGYLNTYMTKHLSLAANKKVQPLHYLGFEQEAENLYCYFEVTQIPAITTIDLVNSLLYDFTNQQINIMHVMVNGERKSYKLDYPKTEASFSF